MSNPDISQSPEDTGKYARVRRVIERLFPLNPEVAQSMSVISFMDSIGVAISVSGALQLFASTSIRGSTDAATLNSAFHAADTLCFAAALFTLSLVGCCSYQMQDGSSSNEPIRLCGRLVAAYFTYFSLGGFALIGYALKTFNTMWGSVIFYGSIVVFAFPSVMNVLISRMMRARRQVV